MPVRIDPHGGQDRACGAAGHASNGRLPLRGRATGSADRVIMRSSENQRSHPSGPALWASHGSPRRRLEDPGRGCEGKSSFLKSARPAVLPRPFRNFRPPRRTRKSVRPATCRVSDRTSDRTMVHSSPARDRSAWYSSSSDPNSSTREGQCETMRNQTASPHQKHRKTSCSKKSGLIAQENPAGSSETAQYALDNHSHRAACPGSRLAQLPS